MAKSEHQIRLLREIKQKSFFQFLIISLMLNCFAGLSIAQNKESVFSVNFISEAHAADQFPNGDWIVCTVEQSDYGSDAGDIYFWIFDSLAREKYHFKLFEPPSFLTFEIRSVHVMPDNGWIVDIAGAACDYREIVHSFLMSYDSLGNKNWEVFFDIENNETKYQLAPDGNILGVHFRGRSEFTKVVKIDVETGEVLRSIALDKKNIISALFVPRKEDVIVSLDDSIHYYKLDTINLQGSYYLSHSAIAGPATNLKIHNDTLFYGSYPYANIFVQFNPQLEVQHRFVILSFKQFQTLDSGIVTLTLDEYDQYKFFYYGGDYLDEINFISIPFPEFEITSYQRGNNNKLAVFGNTHSGNIDFENAIFSFAFRSQSWFRIFDMAIEVNYALPISLRIERISQGGPFQRDSTWNDLFNLFAQDYSGGDFKIQVINDGLVDVNSFWINTHIGEVLRPWICPPYLMKTVNVDSISLSPGDSIWVDFGDIVAYDQWEFPSQFCFWTSGPNGRPDFLLYNNYLCTDNTVSIKQPEKSELQIFPNPARDIVTVQLPGHYLSDQIWEIFDLTGKLLDSGSVALHHDPITINVSKHTAGMYMLKLGNTTTKLLIAR